MFRNKKDVDKHVENLISKLSVKEFKTRAYSVARLYYEVGDYQSCQRYVEQYLTQKDNNAAAYKLLGQALQKLGQNEKALDQFKTSLDIDPTQSSTILDICELLLEDDLTVDPGRARFWSEKAEAIFPRHPVTFRLKEKLTIVSNQNPEALVNLLISELKIRPKDALLHARLIKHYLHNNQIKVAFNHSCDVEFNQRLFRNNFAWYETLTELLKHNSNNIKDWLLQLLLLTVRERLCVLSLTETSSSSKSLTEANEQLFLYDQDLENVAKAGPAVGFGEFHATLLQHHRGQLALHAATFLLKKAKKDAMSWHDATQYATPLMLIAWHMSPIETKSKWLMNAPEMQQLAARRWYSEACYRCSQSGHYLISNSETKSQQLFIERISQCCSGTHWRDKIYEKLFISRNHLTKIKSSHFATSPKFCAPILRLPKKTEVEIFDVDAQMENSNSLHHFVWVLLNYKNIADFKCSLFDTLIPNASNIGPESLNKNDVHAFLYCAALTSKQHKSKGTTHVSADKPAVLPANITNLLCSLFQMKWWDCACKFVQNELGAELTDIRSTLSRGIEVVRCIDSHGLDPELLCQLGKVFNEKAKRITAEEEKNNLKQRAHLYYSSAIPLLEKLKNNVVIKENDKRIFDYTHKELSTKELNLLLEECKLYLALNFINNCEYDNAIEMLVELKSPQAVYHLAETYKNVALNESACKDKQVALLLKARSHAYKSFDLIKHLEIKNNSSLYSDIQDLVEELNIIIHKIAPDSSEWITNEVDRKNSFDENISIADSEFISIRNNNPVIRNISSTPKASGNITKYRTAIDSQFLDNSRTDHQFLERIEAEIKGLQRKDTAINDFMEQSKKWFDENRKLGNDIISTIHTNIQNTTDQFKLLKISVDNVKNLIDECKTECKDVGELKKQIAEMRKEINKLKKSPPDQTGDENDLYHLEEELRSNDASTFAAQLPFTPPVMPSFNPRLVAPFSVPPNPYQLYGQNVYNLYNQYSQFGQTPQAPGAPPLFDPTRGPMNYPGFYPTPEAMFLEVAQMLTPSLSVPSTVTAATTVPLPKSTGSTLSTASIPVTISSVSTTKPIPKVDVKDTPRSLPVNVVITSSDPLPTCTTTPAPILSVTIPSKHIKGSPHNYQITMPSTNATKMTTPPVFSFSSSDNKIGLNSAGGSLNNWNQSSAFKVAPPPVTTNMTSLISESNNTFDKSVVDGFSATISPNNSLNKSRTLSEKSNTSVEYDPCPDFKPIIPLPDEVKVTTGEEDETAIFTSRAKLYRFVDKQWKERGLGEIKLLKHKETGKVRVLMRREQIHKICANHIITSEMEIKPMKNETKAYIWVANDFADETVVLEKFCVRFKTADIAIEFYNKFEAARNDCSADSKLILDKTPVPVSKSKQVYKPTISDANSTSLESKLGYAIGGFTFSSTPSFKAVTPEIKTDVKPEEPSTPKINVFSSFTFKSNMSSPFSNLFKTQTTDSDSVNNSSATAQETKLNCSDVVEEFEPNIEFKPVVPLPALVDQKTGEEDETILFEHRAKLLRFDNTVKEWKERGLGNIKLLIHKENAQKVRLLMRREQIMKVCCNHTLTKDMSFQKMPNMDKAVTWCAKDFSDGELVAETFCLRFKSLEICDSFLKSIKSAQEKLKDDIKAAKEEQNAAKQTTQGFGDQFKPKPGAWNCNACYTNNLENFEKCACCELPKPTNKVNTLPSSTVQTAHLGWGEAFKPKPGSWECKECLIRNEASTEICSACNSPKNSTSNSRVKSASNESMKFKFGIQSQTTSSNTESKESSISTQPAVGLGWGDKFKPKQGSWECKQCFIRNDADIETCCACNNPKDPNAAPKEACSKPTFSFGIPANANDKATNSIFDGTGAHSFKFGIPSANQNNTSSAVVTFGEQNINSNVIIATPKAPENQVLNFSLKKSDEGIINVTPKSLPKDSNSFNVTDKGSFDFVFKPKTKSPVKSPKAEPGDESDDYEYVSEDEASHIHFSPVIPLPDKVEVVTGEENETELYGHRAKLFRFVSGEWKERGIGIVKILKHQHTGKLRVVMRREQVLKICLNHTLTSEIMYTPKDDKTWLFAANDYSEGELNMQQFCLRFKNKEIASEFKEAVEKATSGKLTTICTVNKEDDGAVVFISEVVATPEEKQKARELMLPENFFTYTLKQPCPGCRGCDLEDKQKLPTLPIINVLKSTTLSTPVKTSTPSISSPANSFYGTPANFDRTADATMFRTPLGSLGSNTNSVSPVSLNNVSTNSNDSKNKENTFIKQSDMFGGGTEQKTLFGTPQTKPAVPSDASEVQEQPISCGILAKPKLNTIGNTDKTEQEIDPKTIFANAQNNTILGENKSLFGSFQPGTSSNKSIFGFSAEKKVENTEKPEVKSIFGSDNLQQVNPFNNNYQGSLFGSSALSNNQAKPVTSIFGTGLSFGSNSNQTFGNGNSIFGSKQVWPKNSSSESIKPDVILQGQVSEKTDNKTNIEQSKDTPFKVDNSLSFAALSSSGPGFTVQKNEDFKWEGAGQQLFTSSQKTPNKEGEDKSKTGASAGDDSTAGADEEYDPHYEPIVPLPDKIEVITGEEDEEKLFGERCKLYRYDDKGREWKERGVGELKILYHPERKTYRFLLRREQIHKAVLNMLLFMDLELLTMKNSDRAWTWLGRNYAETASGEQEMLAVRFKTVQIAKEFHDKVVECVRKLQAAAAQAIRETTESTESTEKPFASMPALRLPKHLQNSARADNAMSAFAEQQTQATVMSTDRVITSTDTKPNGDANKAAEMSTNKRVEFQELAEVEEHEEHEEDEEQDDDDYEDYEDYYNQEDDESAAYYTCEGKAVVRQGFTSSTTEHAQIQVLFDQEIYSPKILVTDADTGEILADMLIHTDTEFQMSGDSCTWTGTDYTSNEPTDKTVTINFHDADTAMQFYDSCETSKAATYSSTDPES